jgi:hypothetical protein
VGRREERGNGEERRGQGKAKGRARGDEHFGRETEEQQSSSTNPDDR